MNSIICVIKEVKEGRKYIIFPEGGYKNNKNKEDYEISRI